MHSIALITLLISTFTVYAEDRLDLEGTAIIGNRELPKILYIAPWKPPELSNLDAPRSTLLSEEIAPLDRDVYQRELYYFDSFYGKR
ncbi:MAG TPA: hypothetical protein ENI64_02680 [Gammaproteobacteria bacterium]|nr:hypothetical protein [Gammaproteobacteria bacterium]